MNALGGSADDEKVHECLASLGIKPLIENRSLWRHELERVLPAHDGRSNIGVVMLVHIALASLLARALERKRALGALRLSTVAKALETRPNAARNG